MRGTGAKRFMRCRHALLLVLWILWYEYRDTGKILWRYVGAHETQSTCTQTLYDLVSDTKKNPDPFMRKILPSGKTQVKYIHVEGVAVEISYYCVPDSVDPRPHK
jgi:hypothetical protein